MAKTTKNSAQEDERPRKPFVSRSSGLASVSALLGRIQTARGKPFTLAAVTDKQDAGAGL